MPYLSTVRRELSLHKENVTIQTARGVVDGGQGGGCRRHSLRDNGADEKLIWIHYVTMIEFQDGSGIYPPMVTMEARDIASMFPSWPRRPMTYRSGKLHARQREGSRAI